LGEATDEDYLRDQQAYQYKNSGSVSQYERIPRCLHTHTHTLFTKITSDLSDEEI
jgi:hypothetical protein